MAERLEGELPNAGLWCRCARASWSARWPGVTMTASRSPQRIVADVRADARPGIVALDNGMYSWFARTRRSRGANTLLLDNALATMGAGLPSAMMASLLYPDRRVLAVCGDGGFMMNSQELETAVRLGIDLVVMILQDDAYGMIRWKQAVDDFPDFGLTFGNPDFVAYANSYGATGARVEATATSRPRSKPRSRPAACTCSPSRSTTPTTSASSLTNSAAE